MGRVVEWRVTVASQDDPERAPTGYTITISWDNPRRAVISDPVASPGARSGVEVTIHDLVKQWPTEDNEALLNEITETVALYLTSYKQVSLSVAGIRVDAAADIAARRSYDLSPISVAGNPWVRQS